MKVLILKTHAQDYSQSLYHRGRVYDMPDKDVKWKAKKGLVKEFRPRYETKEEKLDLEDKTWSELIEIAKDRGVKLKSRKKDDIKKQIYES